MVISENKVVSLIYELRKDNESGEVVETLTESNPLTFLFGTGNLLPKFENNIQGLKEGDSFSFALTSDEAYGPVEASAVVNVPVRAFEVDGKVDYNLVKKGSSIPMMDNTGRRMVGVVRDVGTENITMDFNHPMAGVNLFFSGEITSIREASEEEIAHGHIHRQSGCEGCQQDGCGDCG